MSFWDDVLGIESSKRREQRQNEAYGRKLNRQRDADMYAHNLDILGRTGTKTGPLGTASANVRYITGPDGRRMAVLDESNVFSGDNQRLYDQQGDLAEASGKSLSEYLYGGSKANVDNTVANELISMWKNTHLPELDRRREQTQNQALQMGLSPDSEMAGDIMSNFNRSADKAFYDMYSNEYQKAYNRYNTDRSFFANQNRNAMSNRLNMTGQLMGMQTHTPAPAQRYDTEAIHKIAREDNPGNPGLQILKSAWDWNQDKGKEFFNLITGKGGNAAGAANIAGATGGTPAATSLPMVA